MRYRYTRMATGVLLIAMAMVGSYFSVSGWGWVLTVGILVLL